MVDNRERMLIAIAVPIPAFLLVRHVRARAHARSLARLCARNAYNVIVRSVALLTSRELIGVYSCSRRSTETSGHCRHCRH